MARRLKPFDFLSSGEDSDDDSQVPQLSSGSSDSSIDLERDLQLTSSSEDSDSNESDSDDEDAEARASFSDEEALEGAQDNDDEIPIPLVSERGAPQIGHAGFVYGGPTDLVDGVKVAWRCQLKNSHKCKCRVHTAGRNGPIIATIGEHSHLGSPISAKINKFKSAIKERASVSFEPPMTVVGAALENVSAVAQQAGPSKDAARMLVYRKRKAEHEFETDPADRASINVPAKLATYVTGDHSETFLLLDSGANDPDRILVFGRESINTDLTYITALYVDGTFSVTPPMFDQVFVITGRRGGFVQPLFYALLPNRMKVTYEKLYKLLLEAYPDLSPVAVYMDFELALIAATLAAFPDARINGCNFHFIQAILRHLTGGLKKLFMTKETIHLHVRMILALAYVPAQRVREFVTVLREGIDKRLHGLLTYFEATYVGVTQRVRKRSRNTSVVMITTKKPRYAISMWSQHNRLLNGDDATNNWSESAHNRCKRYLGVAHPSLWRFIKELHGLQRVLDFDYQRYIAGETQDKAAKDPIVKRNARILSIMEDIDHRSPWDFLQGIAMNVHAD